MRIVLEERVLSCGLRCAVRLQEARYAGLGGEVVEEDGCVVGWGGGDDARVKGVQGVSARVVKA